jgi:hypothetical protein
VRTSDSGNTQLWFNLGFELQVVFPERALRGRFQNQNNGAHSTFFHKRSTVGTLPYGTKQQNLSVKSETGRNNVGTYKIYILTNDTKFTQCLERLIYVDVIIELYCLTMCFDIIKGI